MKIMSRFKRSRRQKGFTLIEVGIVLALVGVALFFTLSKMSTTSDLTRSQNFVSEFSGIVTNAKRLYATQQSYTGVTIAILRDNNVFPATWNVGGTVTGPWTGAVTTAAATLVTAGDGLTITVPNIPQGVCSDIVRAMASGVDVISVAGTNVKAFQTTINLATAGTQCASAANVSIAFSFGKM